MSTMNSVFVALFLMLVVFMVLFGLYLAIRCFSFLVNKLDEANHS